MLKTADRPVYSEDQEMFRDSVRKFMDREMLPNANKFEEEGIIGKDMWLKAGDAGLLCPTMPEQYGGLGLDFRYNCVVNEVSPCNQISLRIICWPMVQKSKSKNGCPAWLLAPQSLPLP
jgi:alkylation response protein AidB-like acyl-CoA dehydrogenase